MHTRFIKHHVIQVAQATTVLQNKILNLKRIKIT